MESCLGDIMIEIKKRWYVSYKDGVVFTSGCSDGLYILVGYDYAEFDTEAEMLEFIEKEGLQDESE